jgi:hypothetical protein
MFIQLYLQSQNMKKAACIGDSNAKEEKAAQTIAAAV